MAKATPVVNKPRRLAAAQRARLHTGSGLALPPRELLQAAGLTDLAEQSSRLGALQASLRETRIKRNALQDGLPRTRNNDDAAEAEALLAGQEPPQRELPKEEAELERLQATSRAGSIALERFADQLVQEADIESWTSSAERLAAEKQERLDELLRSLAAAAEEVAEAQGLLGFCENLAERGYISYRARMPADVRQLLAGREEQSNTPSGGR